MPPAPVGTMISTGLSGRQAWPRRCSGERSRERQGTADESDSHFLSSFVEFM
jgi:hypothetical protein